jgi:hypothetical protein
MREILSPRTRCRRAPHYTPRSRPSAAPAALPGPVQAHGVATLRELLTRPHNARCTSPAKPGTLAGLLHPAHAALAPKTPPDEAGAQATLSSASASATPTPNLTTAIVRERTRRRSSPTLSSRTTRSCRNRRRDYACFAREKAIVCWSPADALGRRPQREPRAAEPRRLPSRGSDSSSGRGRISESPPVPTCAFS